MAAFRGNRFFLSNFYVTASMGFLTSEHAFMAQKVDPTLPKEVQQGWVNQIRACSTPGQAKRIGQIIPLRKDWETYKVIAMWKALSSKFSSPSMKTRLLNTGSENLVEENEWHDSIWGSCTCPKHKNIPGKNLLGKLLMLLRDTLRKGEDPDGTSSERLLSLL